MLKYIAKPAVTLTTNIFGTFIGNWICYNSGIPEDVAKAMGKTVGDTLKDLFGEKDDGKGEKSVREQLAQVLENSMTEALNSDEFEIHDEARKALLDVVKKGDAISYLQMAEDLEKTEKHILKILEKVDKTDLETLPIEQITSQVQQQLKQEILDNPDLTGLRVYLNTEKIIEKLDNLDGKFDDVKNEIEKLGDKIDGKIDGLQRAREDHDDRAEKAIDRKIAFVHDNAKISDNDLEGFEEIAFPMANSVFSNQDERDRALKILSDWRGKVMQGRIIIQLERLSSIAALAIGYCFHRNRNNKLIFKKGLDLYENAPENKLTNSYTTEVEDNLIYVEKDIDLCIYILANRAGDSIEFDRYVRKSTSELNPYIMKLTSINNFGTDINLKLMANNFITDIVNTRNQLKTKYPNKKINVHLFYNGINALALLIGNQMQRIGPIQLYDYDVDEEDYQKSLVLNEKMFQKCQSMESKIEQENNNQRKEIKFEVITPIFSYGADQKEPEIRPASIKGMMRYMYRVCQHDIARSSDLLKEENKLFGDAEKIASPIRLSIVPKVLKQSSEPFLLHNEKRRKKWNQTNSIRPTSEFEVRLRLTKNAPKCLKWYENLIELSFILCGMGQRSRKGRGRAQNLALKFKNKEDAMNKIEWYLQKIAPESEYKLSGNEIEPLKLAATYVKRPVIEKIIFGDPVKKNNYKEAWDVLLTKVDDASHDIKDMDNEGVKSVPKGREGPLYHATGSISSKQDKDAVRFASSVIVGVIEVEDEILPIYTCVRAILHHKKDKDKKNAFWLDAENEWQTFINKIEGEEGGGS